MFIAKISSIPPTSGVWTLFAISQAMVVPLWRRQLCEHSCSSRHSWAIRGEQTLVPWQNLNSVPPQDRTSTGELGEAFFSFLRWQILTMHFWFHQNSSFWFATGGAGFCVSRTLALRMAPLAVDGGFVQVPGFLSFDDSSHRSGLLSLEEHFSSHIFVCQMYMIKHNSSSAGHFWLKSGKFWRSKFFQ